MLPTNNDGSGINNLNKTFLFRKGEIETHGSHCIQPTPEGPENQEVGPLGANLEAAYHTALLVDSNNKRSKILEKYFMTLEV